MRGRVGGPSKEMTTLVDSARNAVALSGGQFDSRYPQVQDAFTFSGTIPPGRIYHENNHGYE